jgi:hypothetical protein
MATGPSRSERPQLADEGRTAEDGSPIPKGSKKD